MIDYQGWIEKKSSVQPRQGLSVKRSAIAKHLFEFQADLTMWALSKGQAAIFADTGLGKTVMQLEWTRHISKKGRVLIMTPLAVAQQTVAEGARFGMEVRYLQEDDESVRVAITNYDRLHRFDPAQFAGVVLDESSILKNMDGKTRNLLIEMFSETPYKLCCSATPAPNDFTELGNHSEFLGAKSRVEMLSEYFVHDGGSTADWRLKGHAVSAFWEWIASWGAFVKKPSDLGYSDEGFDLPPLTVSTRIVDVDHEDAAKMGRLFADNVRTLNEGRATRRATMDKRIAAAVELTQGSEPALVWCELNDEADAVTAAIEGAVNVQGSDNPERKIAAALWFSGNLCVCGDKLFSDKLTACQPRNTSRDTTENTESESSPLPKIANPPTEMTSGSTSQSTTAPTRGSTRRQPNSGLNTTPTAAENMLNSQSVAHASAKQPSNGIAAILASGSHEPSSSITDSPSPNMSHSLSLRAAAAPSAEQSEASTKTTEPERTEGSTSIIATRLKRSEESSVPPAISGSASSRMIPTGSNGRPCTCGHLSGRRILVSKAKIYGAGLNFQACARMIFMGASHSYEQMYQGIRRCWRFGQTKPVDVTIIMAETEGGILENYRRKESEAEKLSVEMTARIADYVKRDVRGMNPKRWNPYEPTKEMEVPGWLA